MPTHHPDLMDDVARYYAGKLAAHGETAQGVDWNGTEGQFARFAQLCKILPEAGHFSLNDLGCGYGALLDHVTESHPSFRYIGLDISDEMLDAARKRHAGHPQATFEKAATPLETADFTVASGIFNVMLGAPLEEWERYFQNTLDAMDNHSRLGFSFNCLTSYSDPDRKRKDLYYADPCKIFDLCKTRYSRHVALLHDYGLYEFTILVRKTL